MPNVDELSIKGSSINDVTVLVGRGIKDFVTTVLILINKTREDVEGVKNYLNLRDVIYG